MFKYLALTTLALTSTEAIHLHSKQKGANVEDAVLAQIFANHKASAEQITKEDAQMLIDAVDADGNGTFDYHELVDLVEAEELDEDEAMYIWDLCDENDDDSIDAEELMECINDMY